jgi:hemolysin activation/secretion protein
MPEVPIPDASERILPDPPDVIDDSAAPLRVRVEAVRVLGNTVLPDESIEAISRPYVGRELGSSEIQALRDALTRAYVDRGYLTSGAILPDQDFGDGVLDIRIIEGKVGELRITGNQRLRRGYLRAQLLDHPDEPLNVNELEGRLQRLQANPYIRSVHAELAPGVARGESVLSVRIEENRSYSLALGLSNYRAPAIGNVFGEVSGSIANLAGRSDALTTRLEVGEGLIDVLGRYEVPVGRWNTSIAPRARWARSRIVEAPFDRVDIESEFLGVGLELVQPLVGNVRDDLDVGLIVEWRRGRNFVDGYGFSFAEGSDAGESLVLPLRLFAEWVQRRRSRVLALRGQVSFGLPTPGATDVPGAIADATFVTGLLQAQLARRFDSHRGVETLARFNMQLSSDPLLPIEQFAIGGHASVRGFRESQIVRDNGFALNLDFRYPLWRRANGTSVLQVVPFVDVGRAWDDSDRAAADSWTLMSTGTPHHRSGLRVEHVVAGRRSPAPHHRHPLLSGQPSGRGLAPVAARADRRLDAERPAHPDGWA